MHVHNITFTSDRSFMVLFVSQSVNVRQTVSFYFLSSSPGHFSVNDLFTVSKQLAIRFQRNFTCTLICSIRIAEKNFINLMIDLDLSRSQLYKITLWAISRFAQDKLLPNFGIYTRQIRQVKGAL